MSVDFAPSTIKTLCLRFLQKVPYIRKYMTEEETKMFIKGLDVYVDSADMVRRINLGGVK